MLQVLCGLYSKTLSLLQSFPKEAVYRQQTEQVVQQRLQIVQAESDVVEIEKKIDCGQVEELIDQVCFNREYGYSISNKNFHSFAGRKRTLLG